MSRCYPNPNSHSLDFSPVVQLLQNLCILARERCAGLVHKSFCFVVAKIMGNISQLHYTFLMNVKFTYLRSTSILIFFSFY